MRGFYSWWNFSRRYFSPVAWVKFTLDEGAICVRLDMWELFSQGKRKLSRDTIPSHVGSPDLNRRQRRMTPIAGANSSGKLFTRTTRIGRHEGKKAVFYHDTPVVTWDSNTITLRTGEWLTKTTKIKMNQVARDFHLPYHVYAEGGQWFIVLNGDWDSPKRWLEPATRAFTIGRDWKDGGCLFFSFLNDERENF